MNMKTVIKTFVCLFVLIERGLAQDESVMFSLDQTAAAEVTTVPVESTDLICSTCNCSDDEVDCAARKIRSPFTLADWEGLKSMNPTKVDLSQNALESLTLIAALPIRVLNVSDCQLDLIEDFCFRNLLDLVTLDLSKNGITTDMLNRRIFGTPPPLEPGQPPRFFTKVRTLSLAFNDIHSLPQDIFNPIPDLASLDLSGNPLAYIDQITMAAITELTKLQELKLSSCELESLPEGLLRRQRRLERLDLSDNRFTTPPAVLAEATNLVYLNFNKNPVVSLNEKTSISNLTKLKELRLCRLSKLQSISSGALGGLESLTSLKICFNPRLTTLDPDFLMWIDDHEVERHPLLETLHLNNNNLSVINSHFLDRWDKLSDVDFTTNPYVCDCTAQWMVKVLVPMVAGSSNNNSAADMHCKKPQELRGLSFAQLHQMSATLTCEKSESLVDAPAPDAAIILGIMIGIFTTFPLVLVVVLLWRKGYFTKCRGKMRKERQEEDEDEVL